MDKLTGLKFKVVGVTFTNEDTGVPRQSILAGMDRSEAVFLEREPTNQYDKNAVKVMTLHGQIGYVGKDYAAILSEMMDQGRTFKAKIDTLDFYKKNWYMVIQVDEV